MTFLFRQRVAVLAGLLMLAAGAVVFAFFGRAVPVGAFFLSALSLAAAFSVAVVHLRHVALAAVAVFAPLPGLIAAGPFAIGQGLGMSALLAAYGFANVAGLLLCTLILRRVAAGGVRDAGQLGAGVPLLLPVAVAMLTACIVAVAWLSGTAPRFALGMSVELAAGTALSLSFVAIAGLMLPFTENAVTDINRAQERRAVRFRFATKVVETRWGLSVSGIVLAFAVVGYFGAEPSFARSLLLARPVWWAASTLIVFLASYAVGRDARDAAAAALVLVSQTLLSLWLWNAAVGHPTAIPFLEIVTVDAVALMLMLVLLDAARQHRAEGNGASAARLRALEACGVPALYSCAGAAAALGPWIVLHGSMATLALLFLFAGVASTLGLAAAATALDVLVRRRLSVEELYGRG